MSDKSDTFVKHVPCDSCGSRDNASLFSDGHTHCFGCGARSGGASTASVASVRIKGMVSGEFGPLPVRGITEETCRKFDYQKGELRGEPVHIANYRDAKGAPCGQKIRTPDKKFTWTGNARDAVLFGQHIWGSGGKIVVVTEGEIDCMTMAQVQGLKWPVVSVVNGAQGAEKSIKNSLQWLDTFEKIVLMFDQDDAGRTAAKKCAELFKPGKCAIATLPLKDANDMLKAKRSAELISCMWQAKPFRPDGILTSDEVWDRFQKLPDTPICGKFTHPGLEAMLMGIRRGTIITVCAGTGIGKSEFTRSICRDLVKQGCKAGYIALEEDCTRTALSLVGLELGRRLHLEPGMGREDPKVKAAWDKMFIDKVFFDNHHGSSDLAPLLSKIRYMRVALGVDFVVLDHITIAMSGSEHDDERRALDQFMTALASLVSETGLTLICVTQLNRPKEQGHEDGGQTHMRQLRGSGGIGQASFVVIGLERNQQDDKRQNLVLIRVLKNRDVGPTGIAGYLEYQPLSGRLIPCNEAPSSDASGKFTGIPTTSVKKAEVQAAARKAKF